MLGACPVRIDVRERGHRETEAEGQTEAEGEAEAEAEAQPEEQHLRRSTRACT
jgi:hypothetical protein